MPVTISGGTVVGPGSGGGGGGNPNAPDMLIGTSSAPNTWQSFGSAGAAFADRETRVGGRLTVRRIFDGGVANDWKTIQSGAVDIGKRVTWYSIKPNNPALAANDPTEVANVNTLLDSMVASTGHKFILTDHHEPEGDYVGAQALSDFRNGFARFNGLVQARNISSTNPQFKTAIIYQGYAFQGQSPYEPDDYWPGDLNVDLCGFDNYNPVTLQASQTWESWFRRAMFPLPGESLYQGGAKHGGVLQYAFNHGKDVCVGEWGTIRNHNAPTPSWCTQAGVDATKDDWVEYTIDKMVQLGKQNTQFPRCLAMCYFDSKVNSRVWLGDGTESWGLYEGLPNDDSYDALGRANNLHGLPNLVGEPDWPF